MNLYICILNLFLTKPDLKWGCSPKAKIGAAGQRDPDLQFGAGHATGF